MSPPASRARLAGWIARDLPSFLPRWLPSQRWFGGKSVTIASASVEEIAWLDPEQCAALVIAGVEYAGDHREAERYALVVAAGGEAGAGPQIATLAGPDDGGQPVVDASAGEATVLALLRALARGAALPGERGGTIRFHDVTSALDQAVQPPSSPSVRPVGQDQSNTSVRVGTAHVFKLIRRLQAGEHPQLEIGRFLRRTSFRAAPPLDGSITYRSAAGQDFAIGVVEGWVDNRGDGWKYVVTALESVARGIGEVRGLSDDFERLGATTADFHLALSSDHSVEAFAPAPVTALEVAGWRNEVLSQADHAVVLVSRVLEAWPERLLSRGRALVAARTRLDRQIRLLDARVSDVDFRTIRIHGDFHLGQTLKTAEGFALIDFEGEPTKPIARRRLKQCALKDVAGMLRSIDYAAADVRARYPGVPAAALATAPLRRAFRESYVARSRAHAAVHLPSEWNAIDALLALFELEKALYELEYQINNRPDWIHIPLGAVTRLLGLAA